MPNPPLKVFLASSIELKADREAFEILINRRNKDWHSRGVFLELVIWEDFLDAVSPTRKQADYNQAILGCDIFVLLVATKVGRYTDEEFDTAIGQFQATRRPFVFTYFRKLTARRAAAAAPSLQAFKDKLSKLGHFYTVYANLGDLKAHFGQQLDKLADTGFVRLQRDDPRPAINVGVGGIAVGCNNSGDLSTGPQTHVHVTGGSYVGGNVSTQGGTFIGGNQTTLVPAAPAPKLPARKTPKR